MSRRVATTTRENTSRPTLSVPNQCSAEGGFKASALLDSGENGTRSGPKAATKTSRMNSVKATRVSGLPRST